jgi:hypothetical protein
MMRLPSVPHLCLATEAVTYAQQALAYGNKRQINNNNAQAVWQWQHCNVAAAEQSCNDDVAGAVSAAWAWALQYCSHYKLVMASSVTARAAVHVLSERRHTWRRNAMITANGGRNNFSATFITESC